MTAARGTGHALSMSRDEWIQLIVAGLLMAIGGSAILVALLEAMKAGRP